MRETLYQFIHAHYTEVLAVWPVTLLLIGLLIVVGIDSYIQKQQKRIMLIICALVFSMIVQNVMDNWLTLVKPMIMLRRAVDIYGYSIRPVILLLFLYIVRAKKPCRAHWALIGVNAGIHIECKRIEKLNIDSAMAQAIRDHTDGEVPAVFHRRNRGEWLVTMRLKDWMQLYKGKIPE